MPEPLLSWGQSVARVLLDALRGDRKGEERAMNEVRLRLLLQRVLMLVAPIPGALSGFACGASEMLAQEGSGSGGSRGGTVDAGFAERSVDEAGTGLDEASLDDADAVPGCGPVPQLCTATCITVDASTEPFRRSDSGVLTNPDCTDFCGPLFPGGNLLCELVDPDAQPLLVKCLNCGFGGRLPAGLQTSGEPARDDVAAHFAEMAHLEAASIEAFRVLGRELRHYRAPMALVRAARRAARDEARHSRIMAAIARRYGSIPREARVEKRPVRSLEAIAIDNAVEGCVRETYGALVAMWQATRAGDPVVRAALGRIARDEIQHAVLGWKVASWLAGQLDVEARRRVEHARREASRAMAHIAEADPSHDLQRVAGVPPSSVAQAMAKHLAGGLWETRARCA
jgi:hypothetical protein